MIGADEMPGDRDDFELSVSTLESVKAHPYFKDVSDAQLGPLVEALNDGEYFFRPSSRGKVEKV